MTAKEVTRILEAAQGEQTRLARNMADRHAAVRLGLEPPGRARGPTRWR